MPIPTFDQLLRPILELAAKQSITRRLVYEAMANEFKLTEKERNETIASGSLVFVGRASWAMSHLTKASLIELEAKHTYRATKKGTDYLKKHKGPITVRDLRNIEGWKEAWTTASKQKSAAKTSAQHADTDTPEEMIDQAVGKLGEGLRAELLERLSNVNPYRFERVVVDLLYAMGYGGSRSEAAQVTRKSSDEGIDGVINEDRLGLDVIYIQAKRWRNTVGRPEIQSFVGALAGKQAQKGVFITTSGFAASAVEYAAAVPQKVILINGPRLASLMIEHGIGVATTRTVAIQRIDSDYFEDE